ncbi:GNAT family N-acetyltransferase [Vibrio sonorensis]|uniref:GNAT family N-acetyltransferase n=1 Tax=Vibrio sonorensis TaxID=1004316 RepID=UPI0008D92F0D|nr:GNAT family N-acetyltransferase [Vibrio sonorensis]
MVLDRPIKNDELVLDGIAVSAAQRSRGLGSQLLNHVKEFVIENRYQSVRLDVVNTNPKAKALYLRHGFKVTSEDHWPSIYRSFGFSSVATMVYSLTN